MKKFRSNGGQGRTLFYWDNQQVTLCQGQVDCFDAVITSSIAKCTTTVSNSAHVQNTAKVGIGGSGNEPGRRSSHPSHCTPGMAGFGFPSRANEGSSRTHHSEGRQQKRTNYRRRCRQDNCFRHPTLTTSMQSQSDRPIAQQSHDRACPTYPAAHPACTTCACVKQCGQAPSGTCTCENLPAPPVSTVVAKA